MARRDPRSPSPTGSRHSSLRHDRRDDDRHDRTKKDYGRLVPPRSRSPDADVSSQRRYRDRDRDSHRDSNRDYRRSNRSPDPRDDRHRGGRRERSPERVDRREDRRDRDRDRHRDARFDDRDPRRRDDRRESSYRPRRDDSRDRRDTRRDERPGRDSTRPTTPKTPVEDKKVDKLAKLQAWKQKHAEDQKKLEAKKDPRNILMELDAQEAKFSASAIPSPTIGVSIPTEAQSPSREKTPDGPYAGKFDPKAIARKAASGVAGKGALGEDVPLPGNAKKSAASDRTQANGNADKNKPSGVKPTNSRIAPPTTLKSKGNVRAFGFGNKAQLDADKLQSKKGLEFGEEESSDRKLEKLPTLPNSEAEGDDDAALADEGKEADDEEEEEVGAAMTEEEEAAAARAAAEKRMLATENQMQVDEDTTAVAQASNAEQNAAPDTDMADADEEVDPLDAFMTDLGAKPARKAPGLATASGTKLKQQEPQTLYSDGEEEISTMTSNPNDILEMASKARKKKDIPTVNHAKMDYEPVRKKFYTEPEELRDMTEEELANLRLELEGIKVRGADVPKPVQKWPHLGLGMQSLKVIQDLGFEAPTAIQAQAVPAIMSGRDVIGIAKTGSGKTVAFLLPMFRHIKDQRSLAALDGPVGLVMTPTRELATQIHRECKPWLKALNLRAVCCYGGAPIKDQIADLKRGAEIIVCTPGRIIDLLAANAGRVTNLRRVTYLVLDEADRMFDMGFEPQVMKILANIRPQRQTVLFSATFPPKMEALARKALTKPVEILVGGRSAVAPEIEQLVEVRPENSKFHRTLHLLGEIHQDEDARSLIFVDRQEGAEELMNAIMRKGYPCFTIHGGKDQYDRDSVISDFKAGVFPVLVATSVAARGLDVKQLKMVINFDCPNHMEDYVHRAGRTGRAGNKGRAVTYITEDQQRYAPDIVKALKASEQEIPEALQKLADQHLENVKSGKDKAVGGGFGGKGIQELQKKHDAEKRRERGMYKLGGDDNADEEKETNTAAEAIDDIVVKPAGTTSAPTPPPTKTALHGVPEGIDLDGEIKVQKTEVAPAKTAANSKDKMEIINNKVAEINARLRKTGDIRGSAPIDNKGPDAGAFHSTLEINDFPQKARWAVTNRTNVAKILEATGTSITTKGNYYANGAKPGPNDLPKLYILVEGDTEVAVTNAMRELMRLLKDGTTAAMDSEARAPAGGRYSVV